MELNNNKGTQDRREELLKRIEKNLKKLIKLIVKDDGEASNDKR